MSAPLPAFLAGQPVPPAFGREKLDPKTDVVRSGDALLAATALFGWKNDCRPVLESDIPSAP